MYYQAPCDLLVQHLSDALGDEAEKNDPLAGTPDGRKLTIFGIALEP